MYLRRLEIAGFKSFSTRVKLDFKPGISAIVGPNGSGKSNIAEAIRWVLGEQNARDLRARKTEELIFSGTEGGRAKASLAEVILTLQGEAKSTELGLEELIISRRLYRSGESEYQLNSRAILVKDLTKILAQAGFGTSSYTVIGQGMIDSLIIASPTERKLLFEEASGIRAFELERVDTLRKLTRAEEHAKSLRDEIAALEPERDTLTRQVDNLARKQTLQAELTRTRQNYIATELQRLKAEKTGFEKDLIAIQKTATQLQNELSRQEKSATDMAKMSSQTSQRQAELIESLERIDAERGALTEQLAVAQAELSLLEQAEKDNITTQPAQLRRRMKAITAKLSQLHTSLEQLNSKNTDFEKRIALFNTKIAEHNTTLNGLRSQLIANQRNEYLKHALGLARMVMKNMQNNQEKDLPREQLAIILHKLIRMVKLASEADLSNLPAKIARAQQAIARELTKREDVIEQQTTEIIKIRSVELDIHALEKEQSTIQDELKKIEGSLLIKPKRVKSQRSIIARLEKERFKLEEEAKELRHELSQLAAQGTTDDQIALAHTIEQTRSKLDETSSQATWLDQQIAISEASSDEIIKTGQNWGIDAAKLKKASEPVSRDQITRLETELELIGEVDEALTGAHQELSQRIEYLSSQAHDVEKAVADLLTVLSELERRIKQTFKQNFQKINTAFAKHFSDFFGGGSAQLELTPFENGDYGIDITAKPPGKRLELLASLSGGEKALTAMALLAAILDVNPSPFVVLDEVDAALDDANSRLFTKTLKKLSRRSQLMVITHNHETMLQADELFGITTSPKTASTIITVDLREAEALATTGSST